MKRIVYLHQYFVTPEEYGATRSFWFCKELIRRGYDVQVYSALSSSSKRTTGHYCIEEIKVSFVSDRYANTQSSFKKMYLFSTYFLSTCYYLFKSRKAIDLVYATSTPLSVGALALLFNRLFKVKYVFEVRDLWPEFPIQIGAIKNRLIIRLLRSLERSIYRNAEHIVALSPGMKSGVVNCGVDDYDVTVIPNMSKPDLFYPRAKSEKVLQKYRIDSSKLNLIHFGSMGAANGLIFFVEAFNVLKERGIDDVRLFFVGYGSTEEKLRIRVKDAGLDNVFFLGKFNTHDMSEILNCMDVSIVSFKNLQVLNTNSPNKLFDSLSAGKPIIVNSNGWTKKLVEFYEVGAYFENSDIEDFIEILDVFRIAEDRERMALNARRLSIDVFNKSLLVNQFIDVIKRSI